MQRVAVFCGSSAGHDSAFAENATSVGSWLAQRQVGIVYGGARVGLMGALAEGALHAGGEVIGVIPGFLRTKEVAHTGLTQLIEVETMHERKRLMHELSDGVLALPGGFGTLEELFEMLTWAQLGLHRKPIAAYNINGYFDALVQLIDTMVQQGLLRSAHRDLLIIERRLPALWQRMQEYQPAAGAKWLDKDQT